MEKEKVVSSEAMERIGIGNPDANSIFIWGEIDEDLYYSAVQELIDCSQIDCPIDIFISTPGGSLRVARAIADIIERLQVPTTIYLMGEVCSAGFLIPLAGYKNPNVYRVALPSSRAMWHSGEVNIPGMTYHQVSDWWGFQEKDRIENNQYIFEHSNISEEVLEQMFRCEYYLFPEDMVKYGIVDEIL